MRTWICVILTVALLGFIILFEYNINKDFYSYSFELVSHLLDDKNPYLKEDLNKLSNYWEKSKKSIYSLANHSKMEKLDTSLFNMQYYLENGENDKFKAEVTLFKLYLNQTKRETSFMIENVF